MRKPIQWCQQCELEHAEIETRTRQDDSRYPFASVTYCQSVCAECLEDKIRETESRADIWGMKYRHVFDTTWQVLGDI